MNAQDKNILTITCFGHFMSHFNMMVFPSLVLPLTGLMALKMADVVELSFFMYLLFGVTALPWGLAADRVGAKPLMMLFYFGAGICGLWASSSVGSPQTLPLALAGIGLFSGIYHPAGLGLISKGSSRVSMAMGYNGMAGNAGLFAAPLMAGLVNWAWGPSAVYIVLGGMNLLGAGIMFLLPLREPSRETARASVANTSNGSLVVPFLILLGAMMLGGVAYRGSTVILPAYFELKNADLLASLSGLFGTGLSGNLVATTMTALIFLLGMLGQYSGGQIGERYDLRFAYLVFHSLAIPAVLLMSIAANLPLFLLAVVYLFFLLGMQPIENTLVARLTPPRFRHSAYGAKFVLTFGTGSLAVKMIGRVETAWGIESTFLVLGGLSVVLISIIGLLIVKTRFMSESKRAESPATAPQQA